MKKSFAWILGAALLVSACYDDSELNQRLDQHDQEIAALQSDVQKLQDEVSKINTNIEALGTIVNALQNNVYVKEITDIKDTDGKILGYTITFTDSRMISIYNGQKGDKGDQGDQGDQGDKGDSGDTPVIGVKESGGIYYWTVNGQFLTDNDGHPIPVTGNNGSDGAPGAAGADGKTPQLRINEGYWEVSYDGENWTVVGPAQTAAASDQVFSAVKETKGAVVFTLADGSKISIDKLVEFSLSMDDSSEMDIVEGATTNIPYTLAGVGNGTSRVDAVASGDWWAEVEATDNQTGIVKVTAGANAKAKVLVYAVDGKGRSDMRSLIFNGGTLSLTAPVADSPVNGGDVEVPVVTNVEYTVNIEEEAQSWISYTITKAGATHNETLTLTVEKNYTPETRTGLVELKDVRGAVIQSFTVKQESALYVIPTFEDNSFKNFILGKCDNNDNGQVDAAEAAIITELSISSEYTSLAGIEALYNLKKLTISATANLATIDLSQNKNLQEITISKGYGKTTTLASVDLGDLHALKSIQMGGMSALETLTLGSAPKLNALYAYNTALTALDVTGAPELANIAVYGTKLASLDLSKNLKLESANVGATTLATLTLPATTTLTSLNIDNTLLETIDLNQYTELTSFSAAATKIVNLDLSNCAKLTTFGVGNAGSGRSAALKVVDLRKATKLNSVNLYSDALEEVIVPKGTDTSKWNWTSYHMDPDTGAITTVTVTEIEVEGGEEAAEDYAAGITETFVKKMILGKFDANGDGIIDETEAAAVTELDFSECGLVDGDLNGLEVFPIEKLNLDHNSFTAFDVLAYPKLTWLSLNYNNLTVLSIGKNYTDLKQNLHLEASHNKIATFTGPSYYAKLNYLDLSYNKLTAFSSPYAQSLEYCNLSNNEIASLSLSGASKLTEINVSNNKLSSVAFSGYSKLVKADVSHNLLSTYSFSASQTALEEVNLGYNKFVQLDISALINSAALKKIDLTGNEGFNLLVIGSGNTLPDTLQIVGVEDYGVLAAKNPTKELIDNRYSYISAHELGDNVSEKTLAVNFATSVKAYIVPAGSTITITSSGNRKALRFFALGIGGTPTVTVARADGKKVYNTSDNNYCSANPYTTRQNTTLDLTKNTIVIDGDTDNCLYFFGPTSGTSSGGLVDGDKVTLTVGGNDGESVVIIGLNLETYTTDDYGWM